MAPFIADAALLNRFSEIILRQHSCMLGELL